MMLPASATADAAAAPVVVEGGTPFQKRNAHILSAAEAGKSRWGSMEIERALGQAKPAAAAASVSAPPAASTAFDRRNAHVVASAGVGKSRWGTMEVERAAKMNGAASPPPPAAAAAAVVEEARCISLEDRLNLGARLLGTAAAPHAPASTLTAFDLRNARVVASAGVGKSRWGTMEVERAMKNGSAAAIVFAAPPAVAAEEKRAASLEDRVNLGARLLGD